jgi:hypothetical protein
VITLYLGDRFPVYAAFVYAKNERSDLSPQQRKAISQVVEGMKAQARSRMT